MDYPSIEAIRQSCPVVQQHLVDASQAIPIVERDQYEQGVGKAKCDVSLEDKATARIPWGCRGVTVVGSTGCPLRDGDSAKVSLT